MALTKNSQIDLNGNEMILDADADTSITADTDDQIDIKVGGTDTVVITGGAMALKGATPTLTIGDAGAEDTKIVFDGNAQDFYIGLDDSADDLVIGKGSAVGTTPAIVIDENQKVGIGDTPDLAALHVKTADSGASADSGADEFVLENSGDTGMTILSGQTSSGSIRFGDSEDNDTGIIIYNHGSTPYMRFFSNGSEAVRILNNQHLLAGTTTEYSGTSGNITAARQIDIGADDTNLKTLFFNRNAAEGEIGGIAAGVTGFSTMGRIDFVAEGVAGGSQASSIRFKTTDSATEALQWQITQYGTFMPNGNNAKNIGTTSNRVSVIYTSNAVNVSDQTLKTEIEDCDLGLDFINTLQPKSYKNLQSVGVALEEGHDDYNRKHYGLIAQDLKDGSLSDSVYGTKDGEYSLAYNDLIAPLVKALQEADDKIEALTARITTLEGGE